MVPPRCNFATLKTARQDFMMARDAAPNSTDVYVNLAAVALAENKPDEAVTFYNNALAIDSANFNSLRGLISIYAARNQTAEAHARVDQSIAAQPNNASLHFLKGQIYGFERNADGAENEFRRALEIDANYLAAYSALGALFVNTNQQDRAIAEYSRIVETSSRQRGDLHPHRHAGNESAEHRCGDRQLQKGPG